MKKKTKVIIVLIIPILLLLYLIFCIGLYFFEPVAYHAPDLSDAHYSFDLYQNYAYSNNSSLYIRKLSADDIEKCPDDIRLKYVENTILLIADQSASYSQISALASDYGATVTGYIQDADFYQFTFSSLSYNDILEKCSVLEDSELIDIAIPDYFEETPVSELVTDNPSGNEAYYYTMIHADEAWQYAKDAESVAVGMIDAPVDTDNRYITVANQNDYSSDCLYDGSVANPSHGTHVAGIIAASHESETPGICRNAEIYSCNGLNTSLSYWFSALADMITRQDVKVINISMGYNSYIPIAASLGCQSTIRFIESENSFMEIFLARLIDNGYDFLFCVAAGNTNGKSLYKTDSPVFGYAEKTMLRKLDKLNLFSDKPEYCNAAYSFLLTDIQNEEVRDRIIVVGSCDEFCELSSYSNLGDAVDLVAPGENIYSTIPDNQYGYGSGTSMATPFVSGTAALLYSLDSSLTAPEVKEILIESSSKTIFASGFAYPLLDAGAAAQYVTENKQ